MKRLTWGEMRRYWESHNSRRATLDIDRDPDALGNVCISGAPLWLNEYHARLQHMVYENLFSLLPYRHLGARALDVGCGAGRWCRFLSEHGYRTTGIDLQRELVALNRQRYPKIQFLCTSVQEFTPQKPFDLVSSVTVIQHNPFSEQEAIIHKLRTITSLGGYALILENVHDQSLHVFANSVREWKNKFKRGGFELVAVKRYDYNFLTRFYTASARKLFSALSKLRSKDVVHYTPESLGAKDIQENSPLRSSLCLLDSGAKRLTVGVDSIFEPMLIRSDFALPTVHCGFLFRAK